MESKRAADTAAQRAGEQTKEARDRVKDSSAEANRAQAAAGKLRRELSEATGAHEQVSKIERPLLSMLASCHLHPPCTLPIVQHLDTASN